MIGDQYVFGEEVGSSVARFTPHEYQKHAIDKLLKCDSAGLFLDMGLWQNRHILNSY